MSGVLNSPLFSGLHLRNAPRNPLTAIPQRRTNCFPRVHTTGQRVKPSKKAVTPGLWGLAPLRAPPIRMKFAQMSLCEKSLECTATVGPEKRDETERERILILLRRWIAVLDRRTAHSTSPADTRSG